MVDDGLTRGFNTVTPIDLTTDPPAPRPPVSTGTTSGSNWIAITPDGKRALVTDPGSGQLTPFDLTADPPVRGPLVGVGGRPEGIAITPDGSTAYVTDLAGNSVIPVDLTGGRPVPRARIASPRFDHPFGIAITNILVAQALVLTISVNDVVLEGFVLVLIFNLIARAFSRRSRMA